MNRLWLVSCANVLSLRLSWREQSLDNVICISSLDASGHAKMTKSDIYPKV